MLLSIDQVAERAGVHPTTLRRWLKAGGHLPKPLPVKALGGGPLWRECDIEQWRDDQIQGGEAFVDLLSFDLPEAEIAPAVGGDAPAPSRLRLVR
ncbi:MAG TPA: MerR family DNA-binding transcriptional regulator [Actinomycetota bacterium]